MIAWATGPYCTGAPAWSGALARVTCPHPHRRATIWCSRMWTLIGGMSKTWVRVVPTCGAPARSAPHPAQLGGSCTTISSGISTWRRVLPSWPPCPPGRRPDGRRNDFGAGLPSVVRGRRLGGVARVRPHLRFQLEDAGLESDVLLAQRRHLFEQGAVLSAQRENFVGQHLVLVFERRDLLGENCELTGECRDQLRRLGVGRCAHERIIAAA